MLALAGALKKLLQGRGDRSSRRMVVKECHDIATAYLQYKLKHRERDILQLSIARDDLAWDCIADLFKRNEAGEYPELQTYFHNYELNSCSEADLRIALRRLVFTKVNDGIYRNFGSLDPSLRKIICNLKRAVQNHDNLAIASISGNKHLKLKNADINFSLPVIPPEVLEVRLFHRIEPPVQMPGIVRQVQQILARQSEYRCIVALTRLAISIRKVYARMNEAVRNPQNDELGAFLNGEVEKYISKSIDAVKKQVASTYIDSGKMSRKQFNTYFKAVEGVLKDEFAEENPNADTYFEHLQYYQAGLEKNEYRQHHRTYLEYLVQKSRDYLVEQLKKELQISADN